MNRRLTFRSVAFSVGERNCRVSTRPTGSPLGGLELLHERKMQTPTYDSSTPGLLTPVRKMLVPTTHGSPFIVFNMYVKRWKKAGTTDVTQ